ncbi:hypothetical protein ONZ45_g9536 [Pleurotus djamor]|nr:hypothetical protein ONZ45_g9536 [Pleurotus djamor]
MFSSSQQSGLRWNLLYPAAYVHIEGVDPAAWSNMQRARATSPPLPTLRLSIQGFPWIITVRASQPHYGVSCSDVIKTISEFMDQLVDEHEFNKFPYETRRMVSMNYNRNRLQAQDVLGALGLGEGVKRLDWLGEETMVWGVQQDQRLVRETSGDAYSPVSFVLIRKREDGIRRHSQPRY